VDFALFVVAAIEKDELIHQGASDRRLPDTLSTRAQKAANRLSAQNVHPPRL
jgi:hypothetical protein